MCVCVRGNIKRKLQKSLHNFFCRMFASHFLSVSFCLFFASLICNQTEIRNECICERGKMLPKSRNVQCEKANEDPPTHIHTYIHIPYNHDTQFICTPEYSIQDVKQMILCSIKWKRKYKIKPKEARRSLSFSGTRRFPHSSLLYSAFCIVYYNDKLFISWRNIRRKLHYLLRKTWR